MGEPFRGTIRRTIAESTPDWPTPPSPPDGAPNVLVVLFDDVGFSDFGCYGSEIDTPHLDALAGRGVRYTGFHTTAMCSTTRAALLTGRNHHSVGMGCLANFDSGFPGYRGKISADAPTIAESLGAAGYRNYMIGKWHVTPLHESGPTGPFDGWPLGRGFDRFYGFLDAETDQYSPELVRDNTHIRAPGNYETGYHLTEDLFDEAISMAKGHIAGDPDRPWFMLVSPGACHAPHQAPADLIDKYVERFAPGWDAIRTARLARQIALGIVPPGTEMPPRNDRVQAWDDHSADEQRLFTRLAAAYAAMLEHADAHLGRLLTFLDEAGLSDNTIVIALSDNGASQEGGPLGFINAMGPFNLVAEDLADKIARIDDIGGPDTHSNFPLGWAMASNTPLKRYKQNTHGGGIRDPLVVAGPGVASGELRDGFCHVVDLAPTVLDLVGVVPEAPLEGTSIAASLAVDQPFERGPQYFEMFGHRGIWRDGWKAVAYHQPGTDFDDDVWELYHLDDDFSECHDLADEHPDLLAGLIESWWGEAERHQVLPLDDRFPERFAENAERSRAGRTRYVFWPGMGHLPSEVAPDVRNRSYTITATVDIPDDGAGGADGVLVAHGDATCGYSLFVRDGYLIHDLNVGGNHQLLTSDRRVPPGRHELGFRLQRTPIGDGPLAHGVGTLTIDREPVGEFTTDRIFWIMISWSGLDVGFDRGTTVSDYDLTGRHLGPFAFTGTLHRVTIDLDDDQHLDASADAVARIATD